MWYFLNCWTFCNQMDHHELGCHAKRLACCLQGQGHNEGSHWIKIWLFLPFSPKQSADVFKISTKLFLPLNHQTAKPILISLISPSSMFHLANSAHLWILDSFIFHLLTCSGQHAFFHQAPLLWNNLTNSLSVSAPLWHSSSIFPSLNTDLIKKFMFETHKRFKRTLFIRTRQNQQIFSVILFVKLQHNT